MKFVQMVARYREHPEIVGVNVQQDSLVQIVRLLLLALQMTLHVKILDRS